MSLQASSGKRSESKNQPELENVIRDLARFRYALRKFLRFSENAARECGVTPQQHQLMLGIAGYTGRGSATVSELAEFLQERHHSVVGLVERAVQNGLVRRVQGTTDRRFVIVSLTRHGEQIISKLAKLHLEEAKRVQVFLGNLEMSAGG
jgi:DNA-binding MarR family transcriptional regulator